MPTLAEVRQQVEAYPHLRTFWPYQFWVNKEIRALPEILDHHETIKALVSGRQNGLTWLAVCTDRRLIFLNRGTFWGTEQAQMPLDRIQSIDHQFTILFGSIRVFDGVNVFTLNTVLKSSIAPFVKITEEMMYAQRHTPAAKPAAGATPHAPTDVASQLAKLAELKEKGYLTDEEFQIQKKKLLG